MHTLCSTRLICWLGLLGLLAETSALGQSVLTGPGFRVRELHFPLDGKTGFTLLSPEQTGLRFTNALSESRSLTNQILPNGSGVTTGDVDGDGWSDLFFCGLGSGSRLYRNRGDWQFEDITERAGVGCPDLDATGAVFADLDGDGDLDLVVNSIGGGTHIFSNDGKGHFTRHPTPLNPGRGGTSLALADADGDGDLDLYIANYRTTTLMDAPGTRFSVKMIKGQPVVTRINGRPLTDPEWTNRFRFKFELGPGGRGKFAHEELGEPDLFCLNDGHGRFKPVPWTSGAFLDEQGQPFSEPPFDWGLSVMFRDFNGDGYPDLYVCNDFSTLDRFWLNDGRGRFRLAPPLALRQTSLAAMGMDVTDLDRDGYDDFMVVEMLSRDHRLRLRQRNLARGEIAPVLELTGRPQSPRNTLFLNRRDGTYAEIAYYAGLEASEWSWCPVFLDVDLDGYEDLLVPNGFERDNMNLDIQHRINQAKARMKLPAREELLLRRMFPRLATANLAFRNRGDFTFEEVGQKWGFHAPTISQGTCLADLDNDGDLDVIVNNMNDAAGLYRNESSAPRIAVRLKGRAPNTQGIGAHIEVLGGPVYQSEEMHCGGRYCSGDDLIRTFAAFSATNQLRIVVTWRSGERSEIANARANCLYEIIEPAKAATRNTGPATRNPQHATRNPQHGTRNTPTAFLDATLHLSHTHHDDLFDDFERQPLLPRKLSQLGPGVCWFDLDSDGWDDLVIGGGRGGRMGVFRNDGRGGFQPLTEGIWAERIARDQTGLVALRSSQGQALLLAGSSNYEDGLTTGSAIRQFDPNRNRVEDIVPANSSSTGPLALADIDGDGDLDLFAGGRVVPGRYPEPASSRLFRNANGVFQPDPENGATFEKLGLVSGAVFSDIDGDGDPDLLLACEWGPLRVFRNDGGQFSDATSQLGLDKFIGWWNGVNVGDFDGDGRLDIVASNWGRNTRYQSHRSQPLRLFYGDFNQDGRVQLIEAYFAPEVGKVVPWRRLDEAAGSMPFLQARFPTLEAFSTASVEEILGDKLPSAKVVEANWLETTVFLNRGNRFEPVVLPFEAQLAPAFAVCVGDLDGDGCEDIFLSQNFFDVPLETSRSDAGRGLWLRGNGRGGFEAVDGSDSGLLVYGEQRGAALCDYDRDGRLDLAVSQNNAATRLYHNERARPGLRVRLKGTPLNPDGIGSVLRLTFDTGAGPAREIHAGSGYCSQDSPVQVLATPAAPREIIVRWPGGKTSSAPIPNGALEIEVNVEGKLRVLP